MDPSNLRRPITAPFPPKLPRPPFCNGPPRARVQSRPFAGAQNQDIWTSDSSAVDDESTTFVLAWYAV